MELSDFYRGKRVFVTGHTGFKGSWLCRVLLRWGAEITGYALAPEPRQLFDLCDMDKSLHSIIGDIRDEDALFRALRDSRADVVLHLAAQPLVQEGYRNPVETYDVNVMGTVRLLDCLRRLKTARSFVNVTTDKVYRNEEWCWGYREDDVLDGRDPYSNSKSCSELVTHCFRDAYFQDGSMAISTMRAGNVIGGGDFAENRLIPDCVRAASSRAPVVLRNPNAVRPYQHVLDPIYAYLLVAAEQYRRPEKMGAYNVGPGEAGCLSNRALAELFCKAWGEGAAWTSSGQADGFPEANTLRLDCAKLAAAFGWKQRWNVETAVEKTVEWTRAYLAFGNVAKMMDAQIAEFMGERA